MMFSYSDKYSQNLLLIHRCRLQPNQTAVTHITSSHKKHDPSVQFYLALFCLLTDNVFCLAHYNLSSAVLFPLFTGYVYVKRATICVKYFSCVLLRTAEFEIQVYFFKQQSMNNCILLTALCTSVTYFFLFPQP